jgi:large subunit ribosomal protein L22
MPGPKTNEREGTRAVLRHSRMSAYKVRPVLDLIRGKEVGLAREILRFSERDAAQVVGKLLDSAIANADHNDSLSDPDELFVSACYADEGTTIKRWRPRARGRATRIRKRTCHVTVIVSRLPADRLARVKARQEAEQGARRSRRVAGGRQGRRQRRDEQLPGTASEPVTAVSEQEPVEGPEATPAGTVEGIAEAAETTTLTDETTTLTDETSGAESTEAQGTVDQEDAAPAEADDESKEEGQ